MPNWPHSFPPLFQADNAALEPVSNAIDIDTESGEPMTRVRFTGEMDTFTATLPPVDTPTATAIRNYWRYDLKNGSQRVTWDDPLTSEGRDLLIIGAPKMVPINARKPDDTTSGRKVMWRITLKLMLLP